MTLELGVDESGTGAWASIYTVAAVALDEPTSARLKRLGLTDSKALSDNRRRHLFDVILSEAAAVACTIVDVPTIDKHKGSFTAWVAAVNCVIERIQQECVPASIVIDGAPRQGILAEARFMPKADKHVPAVSAASIVAKTIRNDIMRDLHAQFPMYGWINNAGYGTADHQAAIDAYGICEHHRDIKPLADLIRQRRSK